jgi:hypothetical protein
LAPWAIMSSTRVALWSVETTSTGISARVGHVDVGDDEVNPFGVEDGQGLLAVSGFKVFSDFESGEIDDAADDAAHSRGVVDDEYVEGHVRLQSWLRVAV